MHRFIAAFVILLCIFFFTSHSKTSAQEAKQLAYGEIAVGDFSETVDAFNYTFVGKAGDIIVIEMSEHEYSIELLYPRIILLDPNRTQLAETIETRVHNLATLTVELKIDGEHTIVATRHEHRPLNRYQFNWFQLKLDQAKLLTERKETVATLTNKSNQYYAIRVDKPFTFFYQKIDGDFDPEIRLSVLNTNILSDVGYIEGQSLRKATISFDIENHSIYVIRINADLVVQGKGEGLSIDYAFVYSADS